MTPARMAAIHAASFTIPRPWSEGELDELIRDSLILRAVEGDFGFGLARAAAGEAELLTLAVDPPERGKGRGRRLLGLLISGVREQGANVMFLEVGENSAAIALYESAGFVRAGRRPGYYQAPDGTTEDALIYRKELGR